MSCGGAAAGARICNPCKDISECQNLDIAEDPASPYRRATNLFRSEVGPLLWFLERRNDTGVPVDLFVVHTRLEY